jgi:hypothetical protein
MLVLYWVERSFFQLFSGEVLKFSELFSDWLSLKCSLEIHEDFELDRSKWLDLWT